MSATETTNVLPATGRRAVYDTAGTETVQVRRYPGARSADAARPDAPPGRGRAVRAGPAADAPTTAVDRRAPGARPAGHRRGRAGRTGPTAPAADVPTAAADDLHANATRTADGRGPGARRGETRARDGRAGTGRRALDDDQAAAIDDDAATRVQRIDETLTRVTAAHAGFTFGGSRTDQDHAAPTTTRARPRPLRVAVVAVVVLLVAGSGVGWAAQRRLTSAITSADALDPGSAAIVNPADQRGAENVLLVATDRTAATGATARSDTVVVAHLPAGNGPLTVLSIPTDLKVDRPDCARYDPTSATYLTDTAPAQAAAPFATALDVGGPRCATRAVQQLTGLAVTRYVGVDLGGLDAAVDAVSGVRVCTPRAVVDATLGPVAPTAGPVDLDARRAGDFARAVTVTGDVPSGRIERQQQVVAAVLGAALSDVGLLDLPSLSARRKALGRAFTTDGAGPDQVLALARSLDDIGAAGVPFAVVPADPDPAGQGSILRATDAAAVFDALRTDAALPASAAGQAAGPRPSDLRVQVHNATDRPGLAAKTADTLRGLGFAVDPVTNADQPTPQTLIRYSPDQAAAAQLLAATVPAATTVPDPGESGVLQLVLGRSFDGVVRAATTTPSETAASPAPPAADCR